MGTNFSSSGSAAQSLNGPNSKKSDDDGRLEILDVMRGFAALAVAIFHFSGTMEGTWMFAVGKWGFLGVHVFFVISGFVIPYSLARGSYSLPADYGRFLGKRLIRLHPAYLASLILAVCLAHLAAAHPSFAGPDPEFTLGGILAHIPLLNDLLGFPWATGIYWTLAIELQYYLLIGLAFPLLVGSLPTATITLIVFLGLALLPVSKIWVIPFMPLFVAGIAAFLYQTKRTNLNWYLVLLLGSSLATGRVMGWPAAVVSILASLAIILGRRPFHGKLLWFGTISYSFYLLHSPVGNKFINLVTRWVPGGTTSQAVVLLVAVLLSTIAAWVFYRVFELPSQKWSSRIRFRAS